MNKPEADPKTRLKHISLMIHPKHVAMLRRIKIRMIDDPDQRRAVGNQSAILYAIEQVAGEREG